MPSTIAASSKSRRDSVPLLVKFTEKRSDEKQE